MSRERSGFSPIAVPAARPAGRIGGAASADRPVEGITATTGPCIRRAIDVHQAVTTHACRAAHTNPREGAALCWTASTSW